MEAFRKYFDGAQLAELAEAEPSWGVNVSTVGRHVHPPHKPYPDPLHPDPYCFSWSEGRCLHEFQLVFIARGSGRFEHAFCPESLVEAGTVMLLFPGVWHRYRPHEASGWEELWVGFDGPYARYLMQQDCFDPHHPLIRIGFQTECWDVLARLIDTVKYEGVAFRQLASCLVIQLLGLVYASALLKEAPQLRQEQIVRSIRYQIHRRWAEDLDFEALAGEHHVSYVWFRKVFKEITGTSPGQYHLQVRIAQAARMLRETGLSVSEIAWKSGFASEFYFSRIFKKKMGCSPSSYRKAPAPPANQKVQNNPQNR